MEKAPDNWRERAVFPDWPTAVPREIYQLDANSEPFNALDCSVDVAELIWPGEEGAVWALSPLWCPWNMIWDGVTLTDPRSDPPPAPQPGV